MSYLAVGMGIPGRVCEHCGRPLAAIRQASTRFCNSLCRKAATQVGQRHTRTRPGPPRKQERGDRWLSRVLNTGTVGAIGELLVSADLLSRGYQVFRAVSQAAACDLVAIKNGRCIRIEVRTGSVLKSGDVTFCRHARDQTDAYAIVTHGPERHDIRYEPEFHLWEEPPPEEAKGCDEGDDDRDSPEPAADRTG